MTNADKYLKEGVSVREFRNKLTEFFWDELGLYEGNEEQIYTIIGDFLDNIEQPTLTEDERVILRNINADVYDVIGRDTDFDLYIAGKVDWKGGKVSTKDNIELFLKDNVFQFIKERRRI